MASSGSVQSNVNNNNRLDFHWSVVSTDIEGCRKKIKWRLRYTETTTSSTSYWIMLKNLTLKINGITVSSSSERRIYYNTDIASGETWVQHNKDTGNGTLTVNLTAGLYYTGTTHTINKTFSLDNIPRTVNFTHCALRQHSETVLRMDWGTKESYSKWEYRWRKAGGTWTSYLPQNDRYIRNLTHNTKYEFQVRVMRSGSSIWTYSGVHAQTTHDLPRITSVTSSFTAGNQIRVNFKNPLNRTMRLYIQLIPHEGGGWPTIYQTDVSGTTKTLTLNKAEIYNRIPNHTYANLAVRINYGNYTKLSDKRIRCNAVISDLKPSLSGSPILNVEDINEATKAITQNKLLFIEKYSKIKVNILSRIQTKYNATPSYYLLYLDNIPEKINYSNSDIEFISSKKVSSKMKAIHIVGYDSRGLTTEYIQVFPVIPYATPVPWIEGIRFNNYENQTTIRSGVNFSTIEGKNYIEYAKLYIKRSDQTSYTYKATLAVKSKSGGKIIYNDYYENLDNQYAWDLKIIVKDRLETVEKIYRLQAGQLLYFFGENGEAYFNNKLVLTSPRWLGTENLDGVTTSGFYIQPTMDNITTNNYPVKEAGFLEVFSAGHIFQRYTTLWQRITYIRTKPDGKNWQPWTLPGA